MKNILGQTHTGGENAPAAVSALGILSDPSSPLSQLQDAFHGVISLTLNSIETHTADGGAFHGQAVYMNTMTGKTPQVLRDHSQTVFIEGVLRFGGGSFTGTFNPEIDSNFPLNGEAIGISMDRFRTPSPYTRHMRFTGTVVNGSPHSGKIELDPPPIFRLKVLDLELNLELEKKGASFYGEAQVVEGEPVETNNGNLVFNLKWSGQNGIMEVFIDEHGVIHRGHIEVFRNTETPTFRPELCLHDCLVEDGAVVSGTLVTKYFHYVTPKWNRLIDAIQYQLRTQGELRGKQGQSFVDAWIVEYGGDAISRATELIALSLREATLTVHAVEGKGAQTWSITPFGEVSAYSSGAATLNPSARNFGNAGDPIICPTLEVSYMEDRRPEAEIEAGYHETSIPPLPNIPGVQILRPESFALYAKFEGKDRGFNEDEAHAISQLGMAALELAYSKFVDADRMAVATVPIKDLDVQRPTQELITNSLTTCPPEGGWRDGMMHLPLSTLMDDASTIVQVRQRRTSAPGDKEAHWLVRYPSGIQYEGTLHETIHLDDGLITDLPCLYGGRACIFNGRMKEGRLSSGEFNAEGFYAAGSLNGLSFLEEGDKKFAGIVLDGIPAFGLLQEPEGISLFDRFEEVLETLTPASKKAISKRDPSQLAAKIKGLFADFDSLPEGDPNTVFSSFEVNAGIPWQSIVSSVNEAYSTANKPALLKLLITALRYIETLEDKKIFC